MPPLLDAIRHRLDNARAWLKRDADYIQSQRTPFEIIAEDDLASLRYYPPLTSSHIQLEGVQLPVQRHKQQTPLVIVAPLAVNMGLYDLFPERSFVRFMLAQGFSVYMVDWGSPQRRHDTLTLANYFADRLPVFLQAVRAHANVQDISLHGWSFGGLFSYAYSAVSRDAHIRNLVLLGPPCDYHANGMLGKHYQRLSRSMTWLKKRTGFRVHQTRPGLWRAPALGNALGFKFTDPLGSLKNYVDLVQQLGDDDFVVKHATNAAFLDRMEAYPGACVQDMVQYLFTENVLARGRLPMASRPAVIKDINAGILMITGKQDVIVTPACARALLKQVASRDITDLTINGSHMGIVGGREAAKESWPQIANWLAARDAKAQAVAG